MTSSQQADEQNPSQSNASPEQAHPEVTLKQLEELYTYFATLLEQCTTPNVEADLDTDYFQHDFSNECPPLDRFRQWMAEQIEDDVFEKMNGVVSDGVSDDICRIMDALLSQLLTSELLENVEIQDSTRLKFTKIVAKMYELRFRS